VKNKNNSPLNIKSVAKTSGIKKFFENIRFDVKTSEVATLVYNCKNIRLRECLVDYQSSREGMRSGWRTPKVDSLKLATLHKN